MEGKRFLRHWTDEGDAESGPFAGSTTVCRMGHAEVEMEENGHLFLVLSAPGSGQRQFESLGPQFRGAMDWIRMSLKNQVSKSRVSGTVIRDSQFGYMHYEGRANWALEATDGRSRSANS